MDNMNENLENVTTNEENTPVAPVEEPAVEEPAVEEPAVDGAPAEPAPKARKFPKINITRKGLIIGGIAAAVVIIAVVLIVLLTGGNGKVYEYAEDGTTLSVTVLEDGFRLDNLSVYSYLATGWDYERCTMEKKSGNTYVIDGETMRLAHYAGDYYLVVDKNGKAVAGEIVEMDDDGYCYYYAYSTDVTYTKNDDGTYRLGRMENVKLKDAGDGLYSVVSVNGVKQDSAALVQLDAKLGVYRECYRSSTNYKVIEGEEKDILRITYDSRDDVLELWFEGEFLTVFGVSGSYDYLQKQRGDDRIVYLLDEDGNVEDVITITDGKTTLDGVALKELSDGKFYGIYEGQEYRLHLNSNGTYKTYEEVGSDGLRGRAKLVWEPEEKLEVVASGETALSIIVDGKTLTMDADGETIELTKTK